jgi:hypothetical protein
MLHKCANPACNIPFLSLREGKLFLAESPDAQTHSPLKGGSRKLRRREHFWLCSTCSAQFTLHFDISQGIVTVPIRGQIPPLPSVPQAACAGND